VEIESEYPGGLTAWRRFLDRNLRYPQEAVDQGIEGFVTVQFVVDKEGNVSNVEAVSGPQELRGEAVRVIKRSGKWTPAIQNGHKVKSYKKQPIGFRIAVE
jgi:protein TonB